MLPPRRPSGIGISRAKKGAKYHQFFAVRLAAQKAFDTVRAGADGRLDVIWYTTSSANRCRWSSSSPWLDAAMHDPEPRRRLLRPYPAGAKAATEVSTRVNDPSNDDPRCVESVARY